MADTSELSLVQEEEDEPEVTTVAPSSLTATEPPVSPERLADAFSALHSPSSARRQEEGRAGGWTALDAPSGIARGVASLSDAEEILRDDNEGR